MCGFWRDRLCLELQTSFLSITCSYTGSIPQHWIVGCVLVVAYSGTVLPAEDISFSVFFD